MAAGSYIILIKFVGDNSSLTKMEKDMNGRLSRVTKRFGQGLSKAGKMFKVAGLTSMATGLLAQILSPLQEINSTLDNILAKSGNIKDQAGSMNTNVAMYAAMQSAAAAKGVDQAQFNMMGQRIMELVGAAKNGEDNVLSKYKNEEDMGLVLYKVVEALKNMGPGAEKTAMASQIFGGRISGRMAGLLDSGFDEPLKQVMKGVNLKELEKSILGLDEKANLQAALRGNLDLKDFVSKNRRITNKIVRTQNQYETLKRGTENRKFADYEDLTVNAMAGEFLKEQTYKALLPILQLATPIMYGLSSALQKVNWATFSLGEMAGSFARRIAEELKLTLSYVFDRGR